MNAAIHSLRAASTGPAVRAGAPPALEQQSPKWRVVLAAPYYGTDEIEAVADVLRDGWVSIGPRVEAFETLCAQRLGVDTAVAVSSGTAALHLAALALGLGVGDEVIVPATTFVATAAAFAICGATPVFADGDPGSPFPSPERIESLITKRTAAIVTVHYAGFDAGVATLRAIADRAGIALIEDAAHAPFAQTSNGSLGTIGDIGCYSFFATKNVSVGEGGLVVCRDSQIARRVRSLRAHCMTTSSWDHHNGRPSHYDVTGVGLNYRPTEIAAAIGLAQVGRFGADLAARRAIAAQYVDALGNQDFDSRVETLTPNWDARGVHHIFPVLLKSQTERDDAQTRLRQAGIQSSVHYRPVHRFRHYRETYGELHLPNAEDFGARQLTLPLHAQMSSLDAAFVVESLIQER